MDYGSRGGRGKIGRSLHTTPSLHFRPIYAPICAPFASKKPLGSPIFGLFSLAAMDFFHIEGWRRKGNGTSLMHHEGALREL